MTPPTEAAMIPMIPPVANPEVCEDLSLPLPAADLSEVLVWAESMALEVWEVLLRLLLLLLLESPRSSVVFGRIAVDELVA